MIVVIADDFTGAAEIGGIGLKYGLKVIIETNLKNHVKADLLIIATDTRSGSVKNVILESEIIAAAAKKLQPELIFKKIDSVLRGYILEETSALMKSLELSNALIVPANPLLKRVITRGQYYIDGEPIYKTNFSNDPDFYGKSSRVLEILTRNGRSKDLILRKPGSEQSGDLIIVGEASSASDLSYWADNVPGACLPCGAASFFESLLINRGLESQLPERGYTPSSGKKSVFVCGSAFSASREVVAIAESSGHAVSYMPDKVFYYTAMQQGMVEWKADILNKFSTDHQVIVAIRQPVVRKRDLSNHLKDSIAELISLLMIESELQELVIEGGATASAILKKLEITRLIPVHQYTHGVIRMKVENKPNINITMKPGSYAWPEEVWNFK